MSDETESAEEQPQQVRLRYRDFIRTALDSAIIYALPELPQAEAG